MKRIAIIGAGQAGLQLGLGLRRKGYEVTLLTDRAGDEIRAGRVMSSQCMFDSALQAERDLNLSFWEQECPRVEGISFSVPGPHGAKVVDWTARLDAYAQAVDQRIKMPRWMAEFQRAGGELVVREAKIADVESYARSQNLTIVATGKGTLGSLFEKDASRSPYDKPQRTLALTYVKNMRPRDSYAAVCFNLIPGIGEYFVFPALTTSGPCEIMVFEGIPGGPMDCWGEIATPQEHLEKSKWVLETFLPWEAERVANIDLTDENGVLAGRFPPTVRNPIGELPSGALVLGLAPAVV